MYSRFMAYRAHNMAWNTESMCQRTASCWELLYQTMLKAVIRPLPLQDWVSKDWMASYTAITSAKHVSGKPNTGNCKSCVH